MSRVLIAGCGFVGEAAAFLFHRAGWLPIGLKGSKNIVEPALACPFPIFRADISQKASLEALKQEIGPVDKIVHCASTRGGGVENYRAIYLQGLINLLDIFPVAEKCCLFTSSTSVYAQVDGSLVNESSPTQPQQETGRILLEAEEIILQKKGYALRLAGLYGPGRSIYQKRFLSGEAQIEGDGTRWINQLHRDDAAAAIFHVLYHLCEPGIYNVCDDTPVSLYQVYQWLAEFYHKPLPPYGPPSIHRKRGLTNKRIINHKLKSTGWQPKFRSYHDGLRSFEQDMKGTLTSAAQ